MGMDGADLTQLDELARRFSTWSGQVEQLKAEVTGAVNALVGVSSSRTAASPRHTSARSTIATGVRAAAIAAASWRKDHAAARRSSDDATTEP